MRIAEKLRMLEIELPTCPCRAGLYTQCRFFGDGLAYVSGCGPDFPGRMFPTGKLGQNISIEEGQLAARNCMLNALSILQRELGDLDRVQSMVKMLAFVASDDEFYQQPVVANGASQLLVDVFGETIGCPARSAIGVNVLPGNIPVEIELLLRVRDL